MSEVPTQKMGRGRVDYKPGVGEGGYPPKAESSNPVAATPTEPESPKPAEGTPPNGATT